MKHCLWSLPLFNWNAEWERERERFHPLGDSLNACNSQDWVGLGIRNSNQDLSFGGRDPLEHTEFLSSETMTVITRNQTFPEFSIRHCHKLFRKPWEWCGFVWIVQMRREGHKEINWSLSSKSPILSSDFRAHASNYFIVIFSTLEWKMKDTIPFLSHKQTFKPIIQLWSNKSCDVSLMPCRKKILWPWRWSKWIQKSSSRKEHFITVRTESTHVLTLCFTYIWRHLIHLRYKFQTNVFPILFCFRKIQFLPMFWQSSQS